MPRPEIPFAAELVAVGDGAPSMAQKAEMMMLVRRESEEMSMRLDRYLLGEVAGCRTALLEVQAEQTKLRKILELLGADPWHRGIYLGDVSGGPAERVEVQHGSTRRIVGLADGIEASGLRRGDTVYLGTELNVVVHHAPQQVEPGETGSLEQILDSDRIIIRSRDNRVVVQTSQVLSEMALEIGDVLRWDPRAQMAFEKLPRAESRRFFLEDVPDIGRDRVGGHAEDLDRLLSCLQTTLLSPAKALAYALGARNSVFLCGPPGCGKTLMARVAAAEIARASGRRCRFGVVKPAEWEDPYVGVTQQNIRNTFKACREAARDDLVVLFLDEVEAVGRIRGHAFSPHADKFLNAFLCELDGFEGRDGIAIVAASNRKDLIDPALLERLTDVEINVRRPDMDAAREILSIHLPETVPYREIGTDAAQTRNEAIEAAVSLLYCPNADNDLSELKFRDGRTRVVAARELVSGRILEQISRDARRAAFLRDVRGGEPGVSVPDVREAVEVVLDRLRTTLSRANVHAYLADLPQDVDVVSVEPVRSRVARTHRFMNVA